MSEPYKPGHVARGEATGAGFGANEGPDYIVPDGYGEGDSPGSGADRDEYTGAGDPQEDPLDIFGYSAQRVMNFSIGTGEDDGTGSG